MKFAYLILAHHNFSQLQLLLDLLDDKRNDIYVHIDKKIKETVVLNTVKSKLYCVEDRVNVAWGDISQIKAEYKLFRMAFNNGPYDYYHLISGDDLPIKSYCCDEVFVQTIIWNSPFQECIYDKEDLFHGCMRLIDWNRGGPYTWGGG